MDNFRIISLIRQINLKFLKKELVYCLTMIFYFLPDGNLKLKLMQKSNCPTRTSVQISIAINNIFVFCYIL